MSVRMSASAARFVRLGLGLGSLTLAALTILGSVLTGQAAKPAKHGTPLVTDWSHRHLIFSQPRTADEARLAAEDPRYAQQINRRAARLLMQVPMPEEVGGAAPQADPHWSGHWRRRKLHRDWSELLGTGGELPANFFPAKFSFDIDTASCASDPSPDFVVFSTGLLSSGTQAGIVAYDNLYNGCTGTKPTVYWAYDTGGQILTSPVFSRDGTQIAFVQTNAGKAALILLKWAASGSETVAAPTTLTSVLLNTDYPTCTAPCMYSLPLRNRTPADIDDTTSSVFYDYKHDIAWVGGTGGWLNKFIGVFKSINPHRVQSAKFPIQMPGGTALSSPVFDSRTVNVFVGDASGFLYSIDATMGTLNQSARLDFGVGIVDSPIVDTTGQFVYAFASSDGSGLCAGLTSDCAAVYSLSTHFVTGATATKGVVGTSVLHGNTNPNPLYSGGFDSTYYASQNGTGNLYVCGNTGGAPTVYQLPLVLGVPGTARSVGGALSGSTTPCSPVSDIQNPNAPNGPTEWIFASAQLDGVSDPCSFGGCIFGFNISPWQPLTFYPLNAQVLDSNLNIQSVTNVNGGRSGATSPTWNAAVKGQTTDGNGGMGTPAVEWQNLGPLTTVTKPGWLSGHSYTQGNIILDNQNNYEYCNVTGVSGGAVPTWDTETGMTTPDAGTAWINLGPNPDSALAADGGTTGIIMDNVVSAGTLTGASQVYFSTLGSQTCGTSGPGNCAVQASQPGLN